MVGGVVGFSVDIQGDIIGLPVRPVLSVRQIERDIKEVGLLDVALNGDPQSTGFEGLHNQLLQPLRLRARQVSCDPETIVSVKT